MHISRSRSITTLFITLAGTVLAALFLLMSPTPAHASSSDNVFGYAWSANIGWIKMNNCDAPGSCTDINYGVSMQTTGETRYLTGYAWSSNIGWISFGEDGVAVCPPTDPASSDCRARVEWSTGTFKGWARACSVFKVGCSGELKSPELTGGWDGYISLGDSDKNDSAVFGVKMDTGTGGFGGFAWGADVVGWVDFKQVRYDPSMEPPVYVCENIAPATYTTIPPGYQLGPDGITCIKIECERGQPCWCEDITHQEDPECKEICIAEPWLQQCQQDCPRDPVPGTSCWCQIRGNESDPRCQNCPVGSVCWCQIRGNESDPRCQPICDPNGPIACPAGGQCSNIPDDIEAANGVGNPVRPPYRQLADGRCLCTAGYVLNSAYLCVKPTYCELGGTCN